MGATAKGYGHIMINKKLYKAHKIAYYLHTGIWIIKYGLHKCDNKRCINPRHVYEGTQTDNMHDAMVRKRLIWSNRTHCSRSHELKAGDVIYRGKHGRKCRLCSNFTERERYHRNKTKVSV